jgi:hypothetical protein
VRGPALGAGRGAAAAASGSDAASSPASGSGAGDLIDELFVRHRLERDDSLAGLAVRYGVSVSDIKRANGLFSDSAMFARDALLIPRGALPLGPELAARAGAVAAARAERAAGRRTRRPGSVGALADLRGFSAGPSLAGSLDGFSDDDGEGLLSGGGARRGRARPQEVELMARGGAAAGAPAASGRAAPGDRLRRRAGPGGEEELEPAASGEAPAAEQPAGAPLASVRDLQPLFGAPPDDGSAALRGLQRSSLKWGAGVLASLKRAASQPALGNGGAAAAGVLQAADAAIASARDGPPEAGAGQQMGQLLYAAARGDKDAGKAE